MSMNMAITSQYIELQGDVTVPSSQSDRVGVPFNSNQLCFLSAKSMHPLHGPFIYNLRSISNLMLIAAPTAAKTFHLHRHHSSHLPPGSLSGAKLACLLHPQGECTKQTRSNKQTSKIMKLSNQQTSLFNSERHKFATSCLGVRLFAAQTRPVFVQLNALKS